MGATIENAGHNLVDRDALRRGKRFQIFRRRCIEVDDVFRIARTDGDLIHVHVRGVEQTTLLGDRENARAFGIALAQIVVPSSGSTAISTSGPRPFRPSRRCRASAPRPSHLRRSPRCHGSQRGQVRDAWRRRRLVGGFLHCHGRPGVPPRSQQLPSRVRVRAPKFGRDPGRACRCLFSPAHDPMSFGVPDRVSKFFNTYHLRTLGDVAVLLNGFERLRMASSVVSWVMMMTG